MIHCPVEEYKYSAIPYARKGLKCHEYDYSTPFKVSRCGVGAY